MISPNRTDGEASDLVEDPGFRMQPAIGSLRAQKRKHDATPVLVDDLRGPLKNSVSGERPLY